MSAYISGYGKPERDENTDDNDTSARLHED